MRFFLAFASVFLCSKAGHADILVDISSQFDGDTIAVSTAEPSGGSYRNQGDVFITEGFSGNPSPAGGTNLPDPSATGFGTITARGRAFRIGPYNSSATTQLNTWILGLDATETLDIDGSSLTSFGVLFSAVGYNSTDTNNGVITVLYSDATSQTFDWDVADSNGSGLQGLAGVAITEMDLYNVASGSFFGANDRRSWFVQNFTGLDSNKSISSISLSTAGIGDASMDAEFGIYAITATAAPPRLSIRISQDEPRASQVELCWDTLSNEVYQLQFRSSLTTNMWLPFGSTVTGDGLRYCTYDSVPPGQAQKFYRLLVTNAP